jgi:hypothetical protein
MGSFLPLLARLSVPTESITALPSPTRNVDWQKIRDDPPLARFRLDKFESELRRVLVDPDNGDEHAQEQILAEIRRLRRVLDLPDVDMDAFRKGPRLVKAQPAPRQLPPIRNPPPKWRRPVLVVAAAAVATAWVVILRRRKKRRRSDRVPEMLLPHVN